MSMKRAERIEPNVHITLNEDAFLRPNGHFEDSNGQHAARLPPGQQEEEAEDTGETPPLLSPAGGLFIWRLRLGQLPGGYMEAAVG